MIEHKKKKTIKDLKEQLDVEKLVSDKIQRFIKEKKQVVAKQAEEIDKRREQKVSELSAAQEAIRLKREEADQ